MLAGPKKESQGLIQSYRLSFPLLNAAKLSAKEILYSKVCLKPRTVCQLMLRKRMRREPDISAETAPAL